MKTKKGSAHDKGYSAAPKDVEAAMGAGKPVAWTQIQKQMELQDGHHLAGAIRSKRIAINLTERSLARFRAVAAKEKVPYQQLVREAVDYYAQHVL
jgi:hypothetical protein